MHNPISNSQPSSFNMSFRSFLLCEVSEVNHASITYSRKPRWLLYRLDIFFLTTEKSKTCGKCFCKHIRAQHRLEMKRFGFCWNIRIGRIVRINEYEGKYIIVVGVGFCAKERKVSHLHCFGVKRFIEIQRSDCRKLYVHYFCSIV